MSSIIGQTAGITGVSIRGLPARFTAALVIVVGMAGVAAVLIGVLALERGFRNVIDRSENSTTVVVLSRDAATEASSRLSHDAAAKLASLPGVKRTTEGKAIGSAEIVVSAPVLKRNGAEAFVALRGLGPQGRLLRPELELIEGRWFESGLHEVVVGVAAQRQFLGTGLGESVRVRGEDWQIVGVFRSGGDYHESEFLGDTTAIQSAYEANGFNSYAAALDAPSSFTTLTDAIAVDPTLNVTAYRESEYLARDTRRFRNVLTLVVFAVGGLMSLGAVFAALNTMHSFVSVRGSEIAVLLAMGFNRTSIVVSVIIESLLLSGLGACLGAAAVWLMFDGATISTIAGSGSNAQFVFSIAITPTLLGEGVSAVLLLGLVGGLWPALRAAYTPIAAGLRAY